jgi:hypothetical protein
MSTAGCDVDQHAIRMTCRSKSLECASTCIIIDAAATHRLMLLIECIEVLVRCAGTPIGFAKRVDTRHHSLSYDRLKQSLLSSGIRKRRNANYL